MAKETKIIGARTNNLKGITCSFPHSKLTVITGVSGSGKSSLAFDTLYAEGQRRYVESLSTYARQFIERMPRPPVDYVYNIQPAIAIEQKNKVKNARSTVGTASEINDFLRLLFAKIGVIYCTECGIPVIEHTPHSIIEHLFETMPRDTRFYVLAPLKIKSSESIGSLRQELIRAGYYRVMINDTLIDLTEEESTSVFKNKKLKELLIVIDRMALKRAEQARLADSISTALNIGKGVVFIKPVDGDALLYRAGLVCDRCGRVYKRPEPLLFSFYSPLGACPTCQGFGKIITIDYSKVIPNPALSLDEHPIAPFNYPAFEEMYDYMAESTSGEKIPWDVPWQELSKTHRDIIINGKGEWCGIKGFFDWLESKRYKVHYRVMLARFRGYETCPDCGGTRLVPEARSVTIGGKNIAELSAMSIKDLRDWFEKLQIPASQLRMVERILTEIRNRLRYLDEIGLGYLTLDRQTRTLSGGEAQRINLATALGSSLTETLYVLDEPTVGLHPRDSERLLNTLKALKKIGNTVVVVEHDPVIIRGADKIIDLGPGAGENGGSVVFEGSIKQLLKNSSSITAKYLNHRKKKPLFRQFRKPRGYITIYGARQHNLKSIDVKIPLGVFCCLTGVSGSGKSTLAEEILYAGFQRFRRQEPVELGEFDRIDGLEQIDEMILVNQSPLGRSARSNPATYTKAYDAIRRLMAQTYDARQRGVSASQFSFNVPGGRCEECQGTGTITIEMQFLADVEVVCEKCEGKRFKKHILDIKYRGKNIYDILNLTVTEAMEFFHDSPEVCKALEPLVQVGLGYLRLGQNTTTLSGGEAQRLKLASFLSQALSSKHRKKIFLIFDEPTTGLHPADIDTLARVMNLLVDRGYSILVIEHNLDLIAYADWIIDLGPEGGDKGGRVVASGTLRDLLHHPTSYT
ncbi:excinuclease ABC subunit UvrA, partial [Candidatus Sumerlaeota bacterium]|nr:excinuclease ABC subunit UvrA [Candidatus Sumerlaeota bacterium]